MRVVSVLLAAAAILVASCGGPYTPKKINVASDKLAVADRLFDRHEYGRSALEYKDFLATFAGDERGDYAQFRLAESYRLDGEYALAEVEYQILINDYGYSEYVDDAFYLEGLCSFRQSPRAERDQTKTYEALDRLNRFLQLFPTSPRVPEARETIREIHLKLGKKDFTSAKLYFSKKEYTASLVYLNKVIALDSETVWGARSMYYKARIEETRRDQVAAAADYQRALAVKEAFPERQDAEKRRTLAIGAAAAGVPRKDGS
ncbi:MAG TPA: outer membrane protein assembly factor BamD [Candidatus Bathyarchaeia archaeon]|nr:outer membrane protein assembly factor BamD [Candidatus Bathyarchaeia archaeon]